MTPSPARRAAITGFRTPARTLTVLALAAAGFAADSSALASASTTTARSDTPGRVCMFLAPEHVFGLGHVGWAYRWSDAQNWDFGSTTGSTASWHKSGAFADVLKGFHDAPDSSGPYKSYRCRNTTGHDQAAAAAKADQVAAEPYDILTNNCLTRSLEIFETYDTSGGLTSLGEGKLTAPRWYFEHDLDGFEPAAGL